HLELPGQRQGQGHGAGARLKRHRPDPDRDADPQSGRLPSQRHSQRDAERRLRGQTMRTLALALFAALLALPAAAQEEKLIDLKKAPGLDKVEGNCGACHSLDYIPMNSPYPTGAMWDAEVTKMIKAYGAPITDADAKTIKEYLTKNYGNPGS